MSQRVLAVALIAIGVAGAEAAVRTVGNVVAVTADGSMFPFDRPFDLEGRTIRFTASGDTYRLANEPLQWIDDRGALVETFATPSQTRQMTLTRFAYPFGGNNRTTLTFDGVGAIRFGPSQFAQNAQVYDVHIAGIDEPLISPLLRSGRQSKALAFPS